MTHDYLGEKERFQEYLSCYEDREEYYKNKDYTESVNDCTEKFVMIEDNLNEMYQLYLSYSQNCRCMALE